MEPENLEEARGQMLREIREMAIDTASWTGREQFSCRTMGAMETVPRHFFVPPNLQLEAYNNCPQQIGYGQTISQPFIVALMTDFLNLDGSENVLEIGTGCGYHSAIISECLPRGRIFSVEAVGSLEVRARRKLRELGYENVRIRSGNGFDGWVEEAPFEAIIVTAAPEQLPEILLEQLENGGRMMVPIGQPHKTQMLMLVQKNTAGVVRLDKILPVAFVPMVDLI